MGQSRVLLNSVAGRAIKLKRGVRQGDPLSPYLFNIAMDCLARWIQKLGELNFLTPPFPHCKICLLYADDTLLFLRPTTNQIVKIKLVFHLFGLISGLHVNLLKSELAVTSSALHFVQNLAGIIQCKPQIFPIRYLGLPLSDSRLTRADYDPLIDKMQHSLAGWRASLLSVGGRLVLTNSVLTALPQFFMSVFLLPKWLLKKINQIRRKFLWHGSKQQQGQAKSLYMVNWSLVTRPKEIGGLGIRNVQVANHALLMKWMWQWNEQHHAWWKQATITLSPSDKPWNNPHASNFWKNMKCIQCAFDSSVKYNVGKGDNTEFWNDNWYGAPLKYTYPNLYKAALHTHISVAQSYRQTEWQLQHSDLNSLAQHEKEQLLHSLQTFQISQASDTFLWLRKSETFTVSSAYAFLVCSPSPTSCIKNIWQIKAPLRVQIFAWLLLNNRLTTVDNLVKRGWQLPNMCSMCKSNEENIQHLFQTCAIAKEIRNYIHAVFADTHSIPLKFKSHKSTQMMLDPSEGRQARQWEITTCFIIWRERCRRIFTGTELQLLMIVREIISEWKSWFQNRPERGETAHSWG